jgi:hypothetical protein
MDQWTPKKEGTNFELTPILQPLKMFWDQMNIITDWRMPLPIPLQFIVESDDGLVVPVEADSAPMLHCVTRSDRGTAGRPGNVVTFIGTGNRRRSGMVRMIGNTYPDECDVRS